MTSAGFGNHHRTVPVTRLTPLDTSFLRMETPDAHMHVAWRGRFRLPEDGPAVTLAGVRRQIAARVEIAPRFRQRLAPTPAGLAEPIWVDDEDFAVEEHVHLLADPRPALPLHRFDELADIHLSTPLPRDRPLWTLHLAERLEDGTAGILMKVHHAMVDGMSAVALALLLLDADPHAAAPAGPAPVWEPERAPHPARLAVDAVARASAEPWRVAGRLTRLAASTAGRSRLAEMAQGLARTVGDDVLPSAPACFLNGPIGPRRTLVGHAVPIGSLLDVKRARGVSLNDVALTVVAGALRRLALAGGREPAPLKVMVPVSRRAGEDAADPGNQIAFVFVELPVHLADAGARLAAVHEATQAFKAAGRAGAGEALLGALGMLPGPVQAQAAKVMSSPRMYNLVVSNIPGPRFPVYLLGAECVEALPVIPLSEGHALSIGMFSLPETLCFSGYADPGALPEVARLPAALDASIAELAPAVAPAPPRQKTGLSV